MGPELPSSLVFLKLALVTSRPFVCVESEDGQLTTSSPGITTDNGNKLLGTAFIMDDETRDQDERNDFIEE